MFKFDRPPLYPHQSEDLPFMASVPWWALLWEQGLAKSRQVVEHVNRDRSIKNVLVLTPAMCRSVWESLDPEDPSELMKYSDRPFNLFAYNMPASRSQRVGGEVNWTTCSMESLVQEKHFDIMYNFVKSNKPDLIVVDESSWIRNHKASRTKAVDKIMHKGRTRGILNGTPIGKNEMDLYSQYHALDPTILGYKNYYQYRANHARMGGWENKTVVEAINMEKVWRSTAPFTRRRLKKDHLQSLPEKLQLPPIEVKLSPRTWKMYCEMRDELVTFFETNPAMASNGAVKVMRLAQLTSGYLGGLTDEDGNIKQHQEVSDEKTSALLEVLDERRDAGEGMQIVWARFQPEIARLVKQASSRGWDVYQIHGKATPQQRRDCKKVFQYGATRPSLAVMHPAAAGFGLTLVACHEVRWLSRDYSYFFAQQADDRTHRGGQKFQCMYQDMIAVGPAGQRTIDHQFRKIIRKVQHIDELSSAAWIRMLKEE
jgi:hypothetical protein